MAGASFATELQVVGWWGLPADMISVERFEEARTAGFTALMEDIPADRIGQVLDMADTAGLKLLVRSSALAKEPESVVKQFRKHPAILAWYLCDEPNVTKFPELGALVARIRALDGSHPCYVNLSPLPDNPVSRARYVGVEDYREYLDRAVREIGLRFISVDHYPCRAYPHDDGRPYAIPNRPLKLSETWFENLEMARESAVSNGVPLWLFALATAHSVEAYDYPVPTRGALRLQVYASLAYGAKAIQYFTYYTPSPHEPTWFHQGCIERDGRRGLAFNPVRRMNREVHARFDRLVGAHVVSVFHTDPLPSGTRPVGELPSFVRKLDVRGPAIVSLLRHGEVNILMVVNRSPERHLLADLEFAPQVRRISEEGVSESVHVSGGTYRLEPGFAEIFISKSNQR